MVDIILVTTISKNNEISPFYAITINLRNKQFLLISFCYDDNNITSPIIKNKLNFIKITTRSYNSIIILNKLEITNIRKLFHIKLLMFIIINDDLKTIKDT